MTRIRILNLPEAYPMLLPDFGCKIHLHNLLEEVKITKIRGIYQKNEFDKEVLNKKAKFLTIGQEGLVIIKVILLLV